MTLSHKTRWGAAIAALYPFACGQTHGTSIRLPNIRLMHIPHANKLELAAGHKKTHWMWFVFPQLRGLGSSRLAHYFGIADPSEAAEYWDDDLLGGRLRSCTDILLDLPMGTKAENVFGKIDAMKLRSCMTLFANVSSEDARINEVLARYFRSEYCQLTLDIIQNSPKARRMYISR